MYVHIGRALVGFSFGVNHFNVVESINSQISMNVGLLFINYCCFCVTQVFLSSHNGAKKKITSRIGQVYVLQTLTVIFLNIVSFDFQGLNAYISSNFIGRRLILVSFCQKFCAEYWSGPNYFSATNIDIYKILLTFPPRFWGLW